MLNLISTGGSPLALAQARADALRRGACRGLLACGRCAGEQRFDLAQLVAERAFARHRPSSLSFVRVSTAHRRRLAIAARFLLGLYP
jgi:hypothetical protein